MPLPSRRSFGVREIMIRTWLCRSGMQGKKLDERFILEQHLIHVQLDELSGCVPVFSTDGLRHYFYALTAHFGRREKAGGKKFVWALVGDFGYAQ